MAEKTGKYVDTKFKGMRKRIAEYMAYSSRENAAFTVSRTPDVTKLLETRKQKKLEYADKDGKFPSINDLALKATALALKEHPNINSTFQEDYIRTYEDINICMAVALPEGLITPVIPTVDKLTVWEIGEIAKVQAEKAKKGTLAMEDITGGTFTVTNLGMVQVEVATPIINSPQVGILTIGTISPELKRIDGEIVDRSKMYLSLTVDHRIIDGYPAALFLNTVCDILENPSVLWE